MENPQFIERDISWLSFNHRVLQEAQDPTVPLYERIKFLAIYAANLNEFYQVRVSSMRQFKELKKKERPEKELKPKKILKKVKQIVNTQQNSFGKTFREELIPLLRKEKIFLVDIKSIKRNYTDFAIKYFRTKLKKGLQSSILSEGTNAFLDNDSLYLVVQFDAQCSEIGLVKIPTDIHSRFVTILDEKNRFVVAFLDDIIRINLKTIFKNKKIISSYSIKISRDAELYLGDEYHGDLLAKLKKSIEKRSVGIPTRFLYDNAMPPIMVDKLMLIFGLSKNDITEGGKYHNFNDFFGFPIPKNKAHLTNEEYPPLPHPILENSPSIMGEMEKKDMILHFPYQSYEYIPNFIEEAANDPSVKSFHITLYRVASKSKVTQALLLALKKGKKVVAFIEAKARFDEKSNMYWGEQLKKAGAKVIYSYPGIKVHTKLLLIGKKVKRENFYYTYLGTGNFNEKTAKLYCDHALLTCNQKIAGDVKQVFDLLEKKIIIPKTNSLFVSPFTTRSNFEKLINKEIANAKAGKTAYMILKMNSLEDKGMILKLYEASSVGVKIDLIVRGICCLIPGVKGMSENIKVVSIVDRFLEHARLYIFGNNGNEKIYLASADMMTRNLDRRIEVVFPVKDQECFKELRDIINMQLADNTKARRIDIPQSNPYKKPSGRQKKKQAQKDIYTYLKQKVNR